jgi:uncharacterized protein (UPF0276 family)
MIEGGQPLRMLDRICERYPVVMHGVSLSIASTAHLDREYLARLKKLAERVNPVWISDHLCWTGVHGVNLHDLLPVPYTNEALDHVVDRVSRVQDILGRRLTLENVSSYVTFGQSEMTEWEFVSEVANRADCWLLFDVNNVYVSAFNHGFSADDFLNGVPRDRVVQFHVAGHSHEETHLIDTHDHPVCDEVWDFYRDAVANFQTGVDHDRARRQHSATRRARRRARPCAKHCARGTRHPKTCRRISRIGSTWGVWRASGLRRSKVAAAGHRLGRRQ